MNTDLFDRYRTATTVAVAAVLSFVLGGGNTWANAPSINVGGIDQAGGTIKGVVKFDGKKAKRKPIRMNADAYCDKAHPGKKAKNERYVFGDNKTLQNVFVWVSKGLAGKSFSATGNAALDQTGCMYVPHVSGVMVNQDLDILNSDSTLHNVKMNSSNNGSFNEGMPVKGMVITKKFSKPESAIPIRCDVHPWMGAYLHVVEHPFFAVTQQDGTFEIRGLPAGDYELSVWHEFKKFAPDHKTISVSVGDGETKQVTVTYGPKKKK